MVASERYHVRVHALVARAMSSLGDFTTRYAGDTEARKAEITGLRPALRRSAQIAAMVPLRAKAEGKERASVLL